MDARRVESKHTLDREIRSGRRRDTVLQCVTRPRDRYRPYLILVAVVSCGGGDGGGGGDGSLSADGGVTAAAGRLRRRASGRRSTAVGDRGDQTTCGASAAGRRRWQTMREKTKEPQGEHRR